MIDIIFQYKLHAQLKLRILFVLNMIWNKKKKDTSEEMSFCNLYFLKAL